MNLILDIETTGLVSKELKWETDYKIFPRIVSIAWKFGEEMTNTIINQRGLPIPIGATKVHGITDEIAARSKYTIDSVLIWLIEDALKADYIIGHNIYFETSILKANAIREFGPKSQRVEDIIKALDKHKRICTMRRAAKLAHGWSTLEKLYALLFVKTPEQDGYSPHNAYDDVLMTEKIFKELLAQNIIQYPNENSIPRTAI